MWTSSIHCCTMKNMNMLECLKKGQLHTLVVRIQHVKNILIFEKGIWVSYFGKHLRTGGKTPTQCFHMT